MIEGRRQKPERYIRIRNATQHEQAGQRLGKFLVAAQLQAGLRSQFRGERGDQRRIGGFEKPLQGSDVAAWELDTSWDRTECGHQSSSSVPGSSIGMPPKSSARSTRRW